MMSLLRDQMSGMMLANGYAAYGLMIVSTAEHIIYARTTRTVKILYDYFIANFSKPFSISFMAISLTI